MKNKNTSLTGNIGSAARVLMDALPNIYKDNTGFDYYYSGDSSKDPLLRLGNDLFNNKTMTRSALNDIDNREFALINQIDNSNNASFARSASNLTDALNFEGPGFGRRFADNNIAVLKGAASGTQYGGFPIGTIVGGVIGGLSNAASQIIGNKRMKRMQQEANTAYNYKIDSVENKYNTMMQDMLGQQFANYAAGGGYINKFAGGGYAESGDPYATTFNAGGTHEENPYGGIQAGIDPQGTPNVFEENEVVTKNLDNQDYAFSERINVRNDVLEKFNLPTVGRKKDGKVSWADYVKLQKENLDENPNDPIEVESFKEFNNRAIQACEYQKQLEQAEAKRDQIDNMSDDELIQYNQQEQAQQQLDLMAQEQMMAQQQPMMPEQLMMPDESAYEGGGLPSPEQLAMLQQMQQQGYACGGKVKNKYDLGGILGGVSAMSSNIRRGMNQSNNNQQIYGKPYKPTFRDFFKGWANGAMGAGESFISGMLSDPDMFKKDMPTTVNAEQTNTQPTSSDEAWWNYISQQPNYGYKTWAYGGEVPYANDRKRGLDLGRNYYAGPGAVYTYKSGNLKPYRQFHGLDDTMSDNDVYNTHINWVNNYIKDNPTFLDDVYKDLVKTNNKYSRYGNGQKLYEAQGHDGIVSTVHDAILNRLNKNNVSGKITPEPEPEPEPVMLDEITVTAARPGLDEPIETPPVEKEIPSGKKMDDYTNIPYGIGEYKRDYYSNPLPEPALPIAPPALEAPNVGGFDFKNHLYDDYNNIANYLAVRTAADSVLPPKIDRSGLKYYQDALNQLRNTSAPLIGGKVAPAYHDYSAELNQNRADSLAAMDFLSDAYQSNPYLASQAIGNSAGAYNANAEKIRTSNYEQNYKERNLAQEFNNKIDQVNQASLSANNQLNAQIDALRAEALRQIGNNIDSYNLLDQNNEIIARQNHYALMNNIANQRFNLNEALYRYMQRPLNLFFWNRYFGSVDNPASRNAYNNYIAKNPDNKISFEDFINKYQFSWYITHNGDGKYIPEYVPPMSNQSKTD